MDTPDSIWEPLPREEVIKAVERRYPSRIPLVQAKWWGEGLHEQYGERLREFDRIPNDVAFILIENPISASKMTLPWEWPEDGSGAYDAVCVIDDWARLDDFIACIPRPEDDVELQDALKHGEQARAENRYVLFGWWRLFFEKPWALRGMENLMVDYYTEPEQVHRLHAALCDAYCAYIEYVVGRLQPDGFWTSDDLGHQTGPMMSPKLFRTYLLPYYQRVSAALRPYNIHFWLHSCGNNTPLLPALIEGGVDVFHPVQKHTMDEQAVAAQFGDQLTFLAGIDVQHTLQEKTPDEVRREVRFLIDTFDRPEGGMCLAAGNGIVAGTPFENIVAFLDEALIYGAQHRNQT